MNKPSVTIDYASNLMRLKRHGLIREILKLQGDLQVVTARLESYMSDARNAEPDVEFRALDLPWDADDAGCLITPLTEECVIKAILASGISGVIAVLSDIPTALGLYDLAVAIRDGMTVKNASVKMWVIPSPLADNNET